MRGHRPPGWGLPRAIALVWLGSLVLYVVQSASLSSGSAQGTVAIASRRASTTEAVRVASLAKVGPSAGHGQSGSGNSSAGPYRSEQSVNTTVSSQQVRSLAGHLPRHSLPREKVAGTSSRTSGHEMQMWVTGYDLIGPTASGRPAGPGICAVDPAVIALGTRITIAGVGTCLAADTGSAITGARIDVWVPDIQTAWSITGSYSARW